MKSFRLSIAIVVSAAILVIASAPHYEKSTWFSQLPKFDLYKHGFVSSATIQDGSSTQRLEGLAPIGQRLSVTVTREDIHIPWTMYLPFHQFGTITGIRRFDVALAEPVLQGDSVDIRSEVSCFRLFPQLNRESKTHSELDKVLAEAIATRVKEGNSLNQRTNNGMGTAVL